MPSRFLEARIAAQRFTRPLIDQLSAAYLARRFSSAAQVRLLIYYAPNRISYTQVYPFFHYGQALKRRFGLSVRARPIDDFMDGRIEDSADIIMVEPWFTVDLKALDVAMDRLKNRHPNARLVFLDSFAHNELRLAQALIPYIDLYFKKSVFKDRTEFLKARQGDTNLAEYYGLLYDTFREPVAPEAPDSFLDIIELSPGFLTYPTFINAFHTEQPPEMHDRPIDVHSRFAVKGSPWYSAMRTAAEQAVRGIEGIAITPAGHLPNKAFMAELKRSKLCWSPFGYGELCWRDIEAFQTGAVLIKHDMGHLETRPDLYRPGETYLPVRWDCSDLEDVVRNALADADLRAHIARQAFDVCRDYLAGEAFVDQYAPLLFPADKTTN